MHVVEEPLQCIVIGQVGPYADIGADLRQNLVAGDQEIELAAPQTDVLGRMAMADDHLPIASPQANALAIDQTAPTVAAFRQGVAQPPAAPSGLAAVANSQVQVSLAWTDNASDETEFLVERSEDGVNFSQVASLPADTVAYLDTGLSADTQYNYRVRARNAAGGTVSSGRRPIPTRTQSSPTRRQAVTIAKGMANARPAARKAA